MINFRPLDELLHKRMTRREFLKHLAAAAVAMIGIAAFIRNLTNPHHAKKTETSSKAMHGYGAGRPYGM